MMSTRISQTLHSLLSLSVRKKFLIATTVASLTTLSIFSFVYVVQEKNAFIEKKIEHLRSWSHIIANTAEAALSFDDSLTAEGYLKSLAGEPDITKAILYRTDGQVFATFQRSPSERIPSLPDFVGSRAGEGTVAQTTRITFQDEFIGTLLIEVDTKSLQASIKKSIVKALSVVALGTGISVLIAILIQRLITRPLLELEKLAKSVARDGDYSQRAAKHFDDEIGSLVDSVNTMMSGVQERDKAINYHNRNLEQEVSTRTSELRAAMVKAEAASKAKSEFLSTMSHELRTPLNAIVGMSSILASEKIDLELHNYVKIIQSSSDNLLSIINQILDYSKIESGNLEMEASPFSLADCAEEAIDMVAALHWEKPIDFFITIDPDLPHRVVGDITRLRQVIVNLLGNAAKFTKTGYVWLEAKYSESHQEPNSKNIVVAIHDTGIGIPKARQNRLFKTFSQVDSSTTRQYGGTGLGLAISQKLVNAMGSEIKVSSVEGEGTTFWFDLALPCEGHDTIASRLAPAPSPAQRSISVSVPFIPLQQSLTKLFKAWGMQIATSDQTPDFSIGSRLYGFESTPGATAKRSTLTIHHPLKRDTGLSGIKSNSPFRLAEARNFIQRALAKAGSDNVVSTSIPDSETSLPDKSTRILLAEDNKVNQKVFRLIMKREGYSIDIANDGQEAVAATLKASYDLIFMDLQMPKMDGMEACRTIRANQEIEQPWIIGFTANVESEAEPAMREAGMNDYLSKPVRDEQVREALRRFNTHALENRSPKG